MVWVKEDVSCHEEVDDAGLVAVNKKEPSCSLGIGYCGITDGNFESGEEGIADSVGSFVVTAGLYRLAEW